MLVHGRAQGGRSPSAVKTEWTTALQRGVNSARLALPADVDFSLPFYGDTLDRLTNAAQIPLTSDLTARGTASDDEFLVFQA